MTQTRTKLSTVLRRTVVLLLLAVCVLSTWLVTTASGLRTVDRFAQQWLPGSIAYERLDGRIIGSVEVYGLRFTDERTRVSIRRVAIDFNLIDLLRDRLFVEYLRLDVVQVQQLADPPTSEPATPFEVPRAISIPFSIEVEHVQVNNAELWLGDAHQIVDHLTLGASWLEEEIVIRELQLSAPEVKVTGEATLQPYEDFRLRSALNAEINIEDWATFVGAVTVAGSLEQLIINLEIGAPYNLLSQATLTELVDANRTLTAPQLDAQLDFSVRRLTMLNPALPEMDGSVRARATGKLDALTVTGHVEATDPTGLTGSARLAATAQPETIKLAALEASITDPSRGLQLPITVTGVIPITGDADISLNAAVHYASYRFAKEQTLGYDGVVQLDGNIEGVRFELLGETSFAEQSNPVAASGHVTPRGLAIDTLNLTVGRSDLALHGELDWSDASDWQGTLQLQGRAIDPSLFVSHAAGRIDLDATLIAGGEWYLQSALVTLDGQLVDAPLNATMQAELSADHAEVSVQSSSLAALEFGCNGTLALRETVTQAFACRLARSPLDAAGQVFNRALTGHISADARLSGSWQEPTLTGQVGVAELTLDRTHSLGALEATFDLSLDAHADSKLRVHATELATTDISVQNVLMEASGPLNNQSVELSVDGASYVTAAGHEVSAALSTSAVAGRQDTGRWQFEANDLDLSLTNLRTQKTELWRLKEASRGAWENGGVEIEKTCLAERHHQTGELCISSGNSATVLELTTFNIDLLNAFLPLTFEISGSLAGRAAITDETGPQVELQADGLVIQSQELESVETSAPTSLQFATSHLTLTPVQAGRSQLSFSAPILGENDTTAGRLQLDGALDLADIQSLEGRLRVDLPTLELVSAFVPALTALTGTLHATVDIAGDLTSPHLSGNGNLTLASASIVGSGVQLRDGLFDVTLDEQTGVVTGSVGSGDGVVQLDATMTIQDGVQVSGRVSGQNFVARNTATEVVHVSPDLTFRYADARLGLRGSLAVPVAEVTLESTPSGAVQASRDQVIVGADTGSEDAMNVDAQVSVSLGDNVRLEGLGLTAVLGGQLTIRDRGDTPVTASGEIIIEEGQYKAYGQDLKIEQGRLLFAGGPIDDPGLNIRAERQATLDVTVGVNVGGVLSQPELKLFSDPSLPESDQLSYLVFGRPLSGGTSSEQAMLQQAALAVGLQGGELLTSRLSNRLNVDELSIGSEPGASAEQAALVIGKFLTPRLYVSYGYGLFNPISTLKMEYRLSPRWRVVTQSTNEASGGDIQWVFER